MFKNEGVFNLLLFFCIYNNNYYLITKDKFLSNNKNNYLILLNIQLCDKYHKLVSYWETKWMLIKTVNKS